MIFVHSSFRTCSTYVWSLFRKNSNVVAYYEIFNEGNATISASDMPNTLPSSWHSKHPDGASYFLEYMPLLRENGGVEGFDPSFSVERFIPDSGPAGPISDRESAYVRRLIEQVEKRGKIPVLTATRSLGRVAGLKAATPGMHIVLYRSLMQQWCSYTEQAALGNPYFLNTIMEVFRLSGHDPVLSEIRNVFPVQIVSAKDQNLFCRFILLHLYLYIIAYPSADMVLDINRASTDKAYRAELEDLLTTQNVRIDFSQITESMGFSLLEITSREHLFETLRVLGSSICDRAGSDEAKAFGHRILSDLEREMDTVEFHTKAIRSLFGRATEQRDALRAEQEATRTEWDKARAQRDAILAELETVRGERDEARGQRDAILVELGIVRGERDEAREQREAAQAELVGLHNERETLRAERDSACQERDEIRAQCQVMQTELDEIRAALDAAQQAEAAAKAETAATHRDRERVAAERDAANRTSLSATAEIEVLRQESRALRSERDAALAACSEAHVAKDQIGTRFTQLLNWSILYHDSTARSLSWRVTRPLRWLGIGRPIRPPKPDFFP